MGGPGAAGDDARALYGGRGGAGIRAALLAQGVAGASRVEIVAAAGTERARSWATTLDGLADLVAGEAVESPAMILVRLPKAPAAPGLRRVGDQRIASAVR